MDKNLNKNPKSTIFEVYVSDTLVTLKQSQGHQTYNGNADPGQGYKNAKFEKSHLNNIWEKGNIKGCFFFKQKMLIACFEHVLKIKNSNMIMTYLT